MTNIGIIERQVVPQILGVKFEHADKDGGGRLIFVTMANKSIEFDLDTEEKAATIRQLTGGVQLAAVSDIPPEGGT